MWLSLGATLRVAPRPSRVFDFYARQHICYRPYVCLSVRTSVCQMGVS